MPQIRPITDLRNTNEISEFCHSKNEPVFITKNGYGDLVLMSIEVYERMFESCCSSADKSHSKPETPVPNADEALDALWKKQLEGM